MKYIMYILITLVVVSCSKVECTDPTIGTVQFIVENLQYEKVEIRIDNKIVYWNVTNRWFRKDIDLPTGTVRYQIWVYHGLGVDQVHTHYVNVQPCMTVYEKVTF